MRPCLRLRSLASPSFLLTSVAARPKGYRGAVALRVDVRTAAGDLHSGSFGGSVANAAHALAAVLAELHAPEDGAVAAPGFYDDVTPLTAPERAAFAAVPVDEAADKAAAGAPSQRRRSGGSHARVQLTCKRRNVARRRDCVLRRGGLHDAGAPLARALLTAALLFGSASCR